MEQAAPRALSFRKATREDAGLVADLVNSAYRGDSSRQGWTHEADLFDGHRIEREEVWSLVETEGSMILLCADRDEIIGSVYLQRRESAAYLGLFVVKPALQGIGIGKQFMLAAERAAQREWSVSIITISVLSCRHELISFYERRGYRRTGEISPLPANTGSSIPRVEGLQLEMLEKDLAR
jgi:GNAT superfamily N-acetyltransferase